MNVKWGQTSPIDVYAYRERDFNRLHNLVNVCVEKTNWELLQPQFIGRTAEFAGSQSFRMCLELLP